MNKLKTYKQKKTKLIPRRGRKMPAQRKKVAKVKTYHHLANADEFCRVHFKKTKNNCYVVISQLFGDQRTLWTMHGGMIAPSAKTNGRRKTRFTQRMIFKLACEKLLALGLKYLVLHCSGATLSKRYVFKNFYKRFKIVLLKDVSGNAHNGCRGPSVRRV